MNKNYLLGCIVVAFNLLTSAQTTTDVITGLNLPISLNIDGNDLYFSEVGTSKKIFKVDVSATTPTKTTVISLSESSYAFTLDGNTMYISEWNGDISKIDLTQSNPSQTTLLRGLNTPIGMILNGNYLYVSELYGNKISKIDITSATPTATDLITGISGPGGLAIKGNDLYISESNNGKILKLDLTASNPTTTEVITGLSGSRDIAFMGDELYIVEGNAGKIVKINITDANPTPTDVISINSPSGLVFSGNDLYIAASQNKIIKHTLALSVEDHTVHDIVLHPNPSNDVLRISGLKTTQNYVIYNEQGREITSGVISDGQDIDIQHLASGMYFLALDNTQTLKFLKH